MDRRQRILRGGVCRHHGRLSALIDHRAFSAYRRFLVAFLLAAIAGTLCASEIPLPERRSGYDFMSRETRAMQDDDSANPGML